MPTRSLCCLLAAVTAMDAGNAFAAPDGAHPVYKVADRWEFRMTETPGGKATMWAREVIAVRPDALDVRFRSGTMATYDDAMNLLDWQGPDGSRRLVRYPLRVGDTWTFRRKGANADGAGEERGTVKVVAIENVTVPAGTFECFRVEADSHVNERDYNEERSWQRWYCPAIKWMAKERFELRTWRAEAPATDVVDVSELVHFLPGR